MVIGNRPGRFETPPVAGQDKSARKTIALGTAGRNYAGCIVGTANSFVIIDDNGRVHRSISSERASRECAGCLKSETTQSSLSSLVLAADWIPLPSGDSQESRDPSVGPLDAHNRLKDSADKLTPGLRAFRRHARQPPAAEQSETGSATPSGLRVRARPCAPRARVCVCARAPVLPRAEEHRYIGLRHHGRKLLIFIYPAKSCPAFHEVLRGKKHPLPSHPSVAWHGPVALHSSGKTMAPGRWACGAIRKPRREPSGETGGGGQGNEFPTRPSFQEFRYASRDSHASD